MKGLKELKLPVRQQVKADMMGQCPRCGMKTVISADFYSSSNQSWLRNEGNYDVGKRPI
jgi:hypothetical protein